MAENSFALGYLSGHIGFTPNESSLPTDLKFGQTDYDDCDSYGYYSRHDIDSLSPSRKNGISLDHETYLRRSYCTSLQDLGMRLKLPQVTIATAIVFCHRFFHRQSHAKNDRYTIATASMFLSGKVEETKRYLRDVIFLSYEIRNKKNPTVVENIRHKEVYEKEKQLVLVAEKVLLRTLGHHVIVHHPYKPLLAAIEGFNADQNTLAQVAWNFVNDGLRTSLSLQYKPHHIAAGAIFLAAKFLKIKLRLLNGNEEWWKEFGIPQPRFLEEYSNQILELYERFCGPPLSTSGECSTANKLADQELVTSAGNQALNANNKVASWKKVGMEHINIEKIKATLAKRREIMKSIPKQIKYTTFEHLDVDYLIELEVERGVEAALEEEKEGKARQLPSECLHESKRKVPHSNNANLSQKKKARFDDRIDTPNTFRQQVVCTRPESAR